MNGLGLLRQAIPRRERFGIVLAAGEGKRLRPLVRRWHDRDLPKQYVSFTGTRSMLEHTLHRARKLIPGDRLYTVVSQDHLPLAEARKQISGCPPDTVVLQPRDRGTGAGLILPLLHLRQREPEAIVAVFPSDHFVLEEDLFMAYVKQAFGAVEEDPSRIVLLGVQPGEPEPEMGYILPDRERMGASAPSGLRRVREFVEKPSREVARELLRQGGLWNTLVMVFSTSTLLDLARRIAPVVLDAFERIDAAIGTPTERDVLQEAYRELKPLDLSRDVLQVLPIRNPSSGGPPGEGGVLERLGIGAAGPAHLAVHQVSTQRRGSDERSQKEKPGSGASEPLRGPAGSRSPAPARRGAGVRAVHEAWTDTWSRCGGLARGGAGRLRRDRGPSAATTDSGGDGAERLAGALRVVSHRLKT